MSSKNQKLLEELKNKPTSAMLATDVSYDLGALVEFAYEMYQKDKNNLRPPLPPNFPTSRYELISYVLFSDFFDKTWTQRFYGLFVQDLSAPNRYVVAIRGTQGYEEWWDDLHIHPVPYVHGGMVEEGFYDIFKTMTTILPSTGEETKGTDFLLKFAKEQSARPTFHIVGHSLGSALANFTALDCAIRLGDLADTALTTFACPLTGDQTFVNLLERYVPNNTRIVNVPDIVPDGPPGEGYVHVNTELLVDSRWYRQIKQSIPCYHSLLTYLYCLNLTNSFGLAASCKAS